MATFQMSTTLRNDRLDKCESTVGASGILKIRSGSVPANCAAADSGTVGATITLPADWMNAASGGTKTLLGTWSDSSADNSITAGHWRIYDSGGSTCHMQGDITASGGGGSMTFASTTITAAQTVTISTFVITEANS